MERVLILASVASMIDYFNMPNIELLQGMGYLVDVACNFEERSTCSDEKIEELKHTLRKMSVRCYQIDFERSITNITKNIKAFCQVEHLLKKNAYKFIHCHSPIGGAVGRVAGRLQGTKVIYTAHGFHFYKGAPKKNWLIYYPIEKCLSYLTDILITINKEDYALAGKKFGMKKLEYIPSVGVDVNKFSNCKVSKEEKRKELAIPNDKFVLLSVGELSGRKNHQVVIDALGKINDPSIYYVIAGKGKLCNAYLKTAKEKGVENQLLLLGSRIDVNELCAAADVFVHPSVREGLGMAPLEGMAAGLPLISSYVGGIKDYTKNGVTGCCLTNPMDINAMSAAILKMQKDEDFRRRCAEKNKKIADRFSIEKSKEVTERIYRSIIS